MAIDEKIRTALLAMASVTARTGTGSAARIRTDNLEPRDQVTATQDAIIIQVDSETPLNDLSGKGGRRMSSVVLVCRGVSRNRARALAEAVRVNGTNPGTGLAGYSGTFDAWLEDIVASKTPREDGSKNFWYDVNLDFQMTEEETT